MPRKPLLCRRKQPLPLNRLLRVTLPRLQKKTAPPAPSKLAKAPTPLDEKKISSIVKPKAEPEIKYTFTSGELKEYFPNDKAPTVSEVKRKVFNALDLQKKAEERQKAKQVVKDAAKRR